MYDRNGNLLVYNQLGDGDERIANLDGEYYSGISRFVDADVQSGTLHILIDIYDPAFGEKH